MKLLRYGEKGRERPGIIDASGRIRDLGATVTDIGGSVLNHRSLEALRNLDLTALPIIEGNPRIGPCVAGVGKFICIGLNYVDHAEESKMELPEEPVLFMKATSAISGPNDDVVIPRDALKVDWEVELGIVIGERITYANETQSAQAIAGYCVVNDLSERTFQLERSGQWVKGKSADSFGPVGPWLVTTDDVPDPQSLDIWLDVNCIRMQNSNTSNMVVGPIQLVTYISKFMSLEPGDIISTGTPAGVALGRKPQKYLIPGDEIKLGVSGLGVQCQHVRAYSEERREVTFTVPPG